MTLADTSIRKIRRRTVVHISTPKTVGIMTTNRSAIRRENARDWPIFAGLAIDHVGVLSVEVARRADEPMRSAVDEAATILGSSLTKLDPARQPKLVLLTVGKSVDLVAKVAAFHAERDKLWVALEKAGVVVPAGNRVELRVDRAGRSFGFVGGIELDAGEFPKALEVTRVQNAVCIGKTTPDSTVNFEEITTSIAAIPDTSGSLLKAFVGQSEAGSFVARGFGQFDDAKAGAEIFAGQDFLDIIERILIDEG